MARQTDVFNATFDVSPYPQSFAPNHKPLFFKVRQMYEPYLTDARPCKEHVVNQCAVRLSIALQRAGLTLSAFTPRNRIHQGNARRFSHSCGMNREHVLGAQELADFLKQIWGAPRLFTGDAAAGARAAIMGFTGVVFFKDCFEKKAGQGKVGDHIDIFDGRRYFNEIIKLSAGGNAGAGADLFPLASDVWFFHLP